MLDSPHDEVKVKRSAHGSPDDVRETLVEVVTLRTVRNLCRAEGNQMLHAVHSHGDVVVHRG